MERQRGIFYGMSVGPGDPGLMTLNAVRVLERCRVIAAPVTQSGQSLAWEIASGAVDLSGKTRLTLSLPMNSPPEARRAARRTAAEAVERVLVTGEDVAMLTLGDASLYSTFFRLAELLRERGYECAVIPGVPSFCAAAARLGVSLGEGNQSVHILAGRDWEDALSLRGSKVFLKIGSRLPDFLRAVERHGLSEKTFLVKNCGLPGEEVFRASDAPLTEGGYFVTAIVRDSE